MELVDKGRSRRGRSFIDNLFEEKKKKSTLFRDRSYVCVSRTIAPVPRLTMLLIVPGRLARTLATDGHLCTRSTPSTPRSSHIQWQTAVYWTAGRPTG